MKICIVGLGYVGLPLAAAFSKEFEVIGFDISKSRIGNLKKGIDETKEVEDLGKYKIEYTSDAKDIAKADFVIVAVPTPITKEKEPDLSMLESASEIVGKNLKKNAIVVFESTVYPGVTEEICVPIMKKYAKDFRYGYSPERVNPGDKEHTVDKIVKVVSGCDKETTKKIAEVYGKIITAGIHVAPDIKTAEAAKAIENIQRDLNIALMNELSLIFNMMDINTKEVINAASTKWNFQRYEPGLVGGHCIGIDPYYLTFKAKKLGHDPQMILAGREINEHMPLYVVEQLQKFVKKGKIAVLGLTFKEDINDYRNSKVKVIVELLKKKGYEVMACDPYLNKEEVKANFGINNYNYNDLKEVDAIILAVPHKQFRQLKLEDLKKKTSVLIDVKSVFKKEDAKKSGFRYFCL